MVSVHPRPELPTLRREAPERARSLDTALLALDGSFIGRIKSWRWWTPIFIMMVSAVTVIDQLVATWIVVNYMWSGVLTSTLHESIS